MAKLETDTQRCCPHISKDGEDWDLWARIPARPNRGDPRVGDEIPPHLHGFCCYSHMAEFAIRAAQEAGEIKDGPLLPERPDVSATMREAMKVATELFLSRLSEGERVDFMRQLLNVRANRQEHGVWNPTPDDEDAA